LPFEPDARKIAVVGPLADQRRPLLGAWVDNSLPEETPTLLEAVRAACPQSEVWSAPSSLNDEILDTAVHADLVILAVGESDHRTGENNCVADLRLPAGQEELIRALSGLGKPLVLVVFAGRPLVLTDVIRHTDAILYAWHPGNMGAHAVADILFGQVNPSGCLPVTFLRHTGQVPFHYNAKSTGRWVSEYHDLPSRPLFPFGFGLSYTTFEYTDLELPSEVVFGQPVQVALTVRNTGSRPGEAVVQCYIQDCVSRTTRPVRELKGFQRVALQPGESRQVKFRLGLDELSYYGPGGRWVCDPGDFKVWVGADSTATLEGSFKMTG
jgi:beta-glucosidase